MRRHRNDADQRHRNDADQSPHLGGPSGTSRAAEFVVLTVAVLSPWAFGAVEAWAEWLIGAGVALAAVLAAIDQGRSGIRPRLLRGPGLAIVGLALLGLAQAWPMPRALFDRMGPAASAEIISDHPEPVLGDPGAPVESPRRTLSLLPEASRHEAARLATLWVLFVCVQGLGTRPCALRRFGRATAINAAVIALFALVQSITWSGGIYWSRHSPIAGGWDSGGPFVGHGALAAYLNLGLGMALAELLIPEGGGRRRPAMIILAAFTAAVLVAGLIASQSRSGFVGMAVAGVLLAIAAGRRIASRTAVIGILAALAMLVLFIALEAGPASRRLATIGDTSSLADRFEIWGAASRAWSHHRLVGAGLGSFAVAAAPEFPTDRGVLFARAENEYLDILVEGGLIGLAIVLAGLVALALRGRRALAAARSPRDRVAIAGALFSLTALAVQSAGDFSPHIPAIAVTAVVLAAYICAVEPSGTRAIAISRETSAARPRLIHRLEPAGVALLALALLPHFLARARAEARLAGTRLPPPGSSSPALTPREATAAELEAMRQALELALVDRPDWAEGHLRLGLTLVALYERTALDWMAVATDDHALAAMMADPLWLHARAHSGTSAVEIVAHEPVRLYLVPAARRFLEARRSAATLAAPTRASPPSITCSLAVSPRRSTRRGPCDWPAATRRPFLWRRGRHFRPATPSSRRDAGGAAWRCVRPSGKTWSSRPRRRCRPARSSTACCPPAPRGRPPSPTSPITSPRTAPPAGHSSRRPSIGCPATHRCRPASGSTSRPTPWPGWDSPTAPRRSTRRPSAASPCAATGARSWSHGTSAAATSTPPTATPCSASA